MAKQHPPSTFWDAEVSLFRNVKSSIPEKTITFRKWLQNKDEELKKKVDKVRLEPDKGKRRKLKEDIFCITGSGVFENGRTEQHLKSHNGYMIIDIDYDDNKHLGVKFNTLIEDVFSNVNVICYAGKSIGGNGYFLILGIKYPDKHKLHFDYIEQWFKQTSDIIIDKNCSDKTRLRYYSYNDDSYHINENAPILVKYDEPKKEEYRAPKYDRAPTGDIERLVRKIEESGISIAPSRQEYINVGIALTNECGENGREYYHRICRIDPKYVKGDCDKEFDDISTRGYDRVTKGTLIHQMQRYNVI